VPRLRDSPDDLFALCRVAAGSLAIPDPAFAEKDFWVVELLRSVVQPLALEATGKELPSARVMFKGGTSLSKAYGIITRFSEDVDVLVAIDGYGTGARDKQVLRPLCDRAQVDLGIADTGVDRLGYKTGVTRNVDYTYPQRIPSEAIRPSVRLEMGIRGGVLPGTEQCSIRSYIADHLLAESDDADFDELAPVTVETISPIRTLAEKLALLHHAGVQALAGNDKPSGNVSNRVSNGDRFPRTVVNPDTVNSQVSGLQRAPMNPLPLAGSYARPYEPVNKPVSTSVKRRTSGGWADT